MMGNGAIDPEAVDAFIDAYYALDNQVTANPLAKWDAATILDAAIVAIVAVCDNGLGDENYFATLNRTSDRIETKANGYLAGVVDDVAEQTIVNIVESIRTVSIRNGKTRIALPIFLADVDCDELSTKSVIGATLMAFDSALAQQRDVAVLQTK